MKDNTLRESLNDILAKAVVGEHYILVNANGTKTVNLARKRIEALLAEEVRKVKIEELELILNGYGWGEGEEAANFIIKDRIAELEKDK